MTKYEPQNKHSTVSGSQSLPWHLQQERLSEAGTVDKGPWTIGFALIVAVHVLTIDKNIQPVELWQYFSNTLYDLFRLQYI